MLKPKTNDDKKNISANKLGTTFSKLSTKIAGN
jgi:hypothetical protein